MSDRSAWMMLASATPFYPFDPDPATIHIEDIARALSHICRYGGHVRRFYSVAEHCVHVASVAPEPLKLDALLHDGAEAYLGDIPRPIKKHPDMEGWRAAEMIVNAALADRFDLARPMPLVVKAIDDRIILDEWAALMPATNLDIGVSGPGLGIHIHGWAPDQARDAFMSAFETYRRTR